MVVLLVHQTILGIVPQSVQYIHLKIQELNGLINTSQYDYTTYLVCGSTTIARGMDEDPMPVDINAV